MNKASKKIKKASSLSEKELALVNDICEEIFSHSPRPVVCIAICAHIVGTVVFSSDWTLSKDLVIDLISKTVQI